MAEKDEVRGHSFDGIQEYDNDLPRWWVNIFLLTAIYSIGYVIYMHMGFRDSDEVQLAARLAELQAMQKTSQPAETSSDPSVSPSTTLLNLTSDQTALAEGKKSFDAKCAACHRTDGGGLVGPNLTDDYWIHGGEITDIKKVVVEGVPSKGMVAWKGLMTPSEINSVVAYIWTLKGTTPENPKAPEGEMASKEEASAADAASAPVAVESTTTEDSQEDTTDDASAPTEEAGAGESAKQES